MLTPEELERRRGFVTASEIPAILGVSPWANAADVFLAKKRGVVFQGNDATRAGNLLEPVVLEWAKSQLGPLIGGGWHVHENGLMAATLDDMTADREPVEAKTSGITGPGSPHQWGADGTDEIPDYYLLQVQAELLVTGAARAFVPALIGNRGFVMYVVNANPELQGIIQVNAESFWVDHVLADVMPDNVRPSLDTLKRVIRTPGKSVEIADQLALDYLEAKRIADEATEREESAKVSLLSAIGDGEVAKWSGGQFTFREQSRKGHFVKDSTFRVLRQAKSKGEPCLATAK